MGTAIGFVLYYYVLRHMAVSKVALITLVTPVCALALGRLLNGEALTAGTIAGAACIIGGLLFYQFGLPSIARVRRALGLTSV